MVCAQLLGLPLFFAMTSGVSGLAATVSQPATPMAACSVAHSWLIVADRNEQIWRVPLQGDDRSPELLAHLDVWALAPADSQSFWAITANGGELVRMSLAGDPTERRALPERMTEIAAADRDLVAARMPMAPGGLLLWRGKPGALRPWALPVERISTGSGAIALENTVALSSDGALTAVVWPIFRAELALYDRQGRLARTVVLPYFGAQWAPLGVDPIDAMAGEASAIPRPYADVLVTAGRIWCLSGQEGAWVEGGTKRGRHVVEVNRDGAVMAIHELSRDTCQLVVGPTDEALAVGRDLTVVKIPQGDARSATPIDPERDE